MLAKPGVARVLVRAAEGSAPTGAETHLVGHIAGLPARVLLRDRVQPAPGEVVPLAVNPANIHLFDSATGMRL